MAEELTYDQVVEQIPGYVLGALEPEEMIAVDNYLQKQRRLLALLQESEETLLQLAHSAPDAPMPADARQRLMARVRAEQAPSGPKTPGSLRLVGGPLWQVAAAVAFLLLIPLGIYTATLQGQLSQLRAEQEMLQRIRQEQLRLLAGTRQAVVLPGTDAAPAAHGAFYLSGDEAMILFEGLEALPADQVYQLWLIPAEGDPVPAGLLPVTANAPTWQTISIPPGAQGFAAVGVSVEPAGGSLAPTGPIVLLGKSG